MSCMILTEKLYAAPEASSIWCAGAWIDGRISIINAEAGGLEYEFQSNYEIGGYRLAFSRELATVFTASFSDNALNAYRWNTGETLWSSRVEGPHCLTIDGRNGVLYAGCERSLIVQFAASDGRELGSIGGVDRVWVAETPQHLIFERRDRVEIIGSNERRSFLKSGLVLTTVASCADYILLTEQDGTASCVNARSGDRLWALKMDGGAKINAAAWSDYFEAFVAIQQPEKVSANLITINPVTSCLTTLMAIESGITGAFCQNGKYFVHAKGDIFDLAQRRRTGKWII
jgi:outer membrane protein assembly factor BamB